MTETYLDVEADVTAAIWRRATHRILWLTTGRWVAIGTLALAVAAAALWLSSGLSTSSIVVSELTAGGVLILGLMFLVASLRRRNPALNDGHFHFIARDDGYTISGPFGEQMVKWSVYRKAWVDSAFVYLFLTNRSAQCIPTNLIPDPEPLVAHLRGIGLLKSQPKAFFLF